MKKALLFYVVAFMAIALASCQESKKVSTYVLDGDILTELTDESWFRVHQIGATKETKVIRLKPLIDAAAASGGGSATFIEDTDTPTSYAGNAGRVPVVNAGEYALEFVTFPAGSFLGSTDTPTSYAGKAGAVPVVNDAENALELLVGDDISDILVLLNDPIGLFVFGGYDLPVGAYMGKLLDSGSKVCTLTGIVIEVSSTSSVNFTWNMYYNAAGATLIGATQIFTSAQTVTATTEKTVINPASMAVTVIPANVTVWCEIITSTAAADCVTIQPNVTKSNS